jgi:hypothetical protein
MPEPSPVRFVTQEAVMHPNTIFELATLRYRDLQDDAARQRLASEAVATRGRQRGNVAPPPIRIRFGSLLIAVGTRLQRMTEVQKPVAPLCDALHEGPSRSGDGASGTAATLLPT